jgi:hypothetical protein
MPAAALAQNLRAHHAEAAVRAELDVLRHRGLKEAGPAGAGVELCVRAEQLRPAPGAAIDAVVLDVPVGAREGSLGAVAAQNLVLRRREPLAPLLLAQVNFAIGVGVDVHGLDVSVLAGRRLNICGAAFSRQASASLLPAMGPRSAWVTQLPMLSYSEWQMSYGERAALEGILAQQRPRLAVEIGTANGGSLARIARYSDEVHSFDLAAPPTALTDLDNVTYHTGDSHVLLPDVLQTFARAGRSIDFVLVDGDHSADGVRRDIHDLLSCAAVANTVSVLHDTLNEVVRSGIESVDLTQRPKVRLGELDLVPGYLARREPYRLQLWGGLGLIVVDAASATVRTGPIRDDRFHALFALVRTTRDVMSEIERGGRPLDATTSSELAQLFDTHLKQHRSDGPADELRRLHERLDQIEHSRSWRITAPLRWTKRRFQRLVAR